MGQWHLLPLFADFTVCWTAFTLAADVPKQHNDFSCLQSGIMVQACRVARYLRDLLRKSYCIFLMSDVFVIAGATAAEHIL